MTLGTDKIRRMFTPTPRSNNTAELHDKICEGYIALGEYLDRLLGPCDPRTVELVLDRLKESSMWANFAISQIHPGIQIDKSESLPPIDGLAEPVRGSAVGVHEDIRRFIPSPVIFATDTSSGDSTVQ